MDNPVMATTHDFSGLPRSSRSSNRRWRTRLVVTLAVVLGSTVVIGLGAGPLGGLPASATTTHHRSSGHASTSSAGSSSIGGSDLFVVDGTSGSATQSGSNSWRLALTSATVLWFKDRPFRGSGSVSAQSLVSTWATKFAGSPPYGAVLAPAGPSGHHPTAIKLTSPAFDSSSGVLSFTVTPDAGESTADASWLSRLTAASAKKNGRVVLFIDNSSSTGPTEVANSPEDEDIIEYFNEIEFSDEITINVADLGTYFALTISCPPPESPSIPGPDFDLTMYNSDDSASTTCNNQIPLIFYKTQLVAKQYGSCPDGSICSFLIVLSNASTDTIYCQTIFQLIMTSGNQTIIPDLEPATLPIVNNNLHQCLLTDTCTLSTTKTGSINLGTESPNS